MTEQRRGLVYGVVAYGLWGAVALYWKMLQGVDAVELIAHRAIWGLVAFLAIAAGAGQLGAVRAAMRDGRTVLVMLLSATLLAVNWAVFVWATLAGHLLDASVGYFINPLVSIAMGTILLRERLSRLQWAAIALAAIGVGVVAIHAGEVPWIALVLALSFGSYGLVRKVARAPALVGSTVETILMLPVALGYLAYLHGGAFATGGPSMIARLVGTGVITAVPLIFFTSAARRLPLSTIGFLQYMTPTGQFIVAIAAFGEPLVREKLFAFAFIWAGLAVFSIDLVRRARRS